MQKKQFNIYNIDTPGLALERGFSSLETSAATFEINSALGSDDKAPLPD
jgi:hypothetical protein